MELLGFLLCLPIGLLFGMVGAGGSILTLPVLVYLFQVDVSTATVYSLFIVGVTSLVGALSCMQKRQFDKRAAFDFGLPAVISVAITKLFIAPVIPAVLFTVGNVACTKETFLMCLLAVLMLISSCRMIGLKTAGIQKDRGRSRLGNAVRLTVIGAVVGALSGLVGVGGGFLIIPALVLFCKLTIKQAVGTSLTIVTIQSAVGFLCGIYSHSIAANPIDWSVILPITGAAIVGVLMGTMLSKKVATSKLQVGFGWLICVTAFCIMLQEAILK